MPLFAALHRLTVVAPPLEKLVKLSAQIVVVLSSGITTLTVSVTGLTVITTIAVSHKITTPVSHTI